MIFFIFLKNKINVYLEHAIKKLELYIETKKIKVLNSTFAYDDNLVKYLFLKLPEIEVCVLNNNTQINFHL